ncbi:hypothetical protein BA895_14170 [Humibacillus sp. DSM 29435]|uniref:hypothetical protein n=1 Tax=Humibacillus sp. DSM 29435 TaxID=1869167 RepID=UPI0008723953|nr:hypothetical protein [Humibacillus sp. DSM 29435]OFE17921.1 hypothetical protein BA895_14170 [Humibacillus sp. DSM 29435]
MPIVFIHGVAVRDDDPVLARRLQPLGEVPWTTIESHLRQHVAPVISDDPEGVPVMRIYWGDLGARFAWGGGSLVSRPSNPEGLERVADAAEEVADAAATVTPTAVADAGRPTLRERRVRGVRGAVTAIRRPLEDFVPVFIGDVMTYIASRGDAEAPGPIIQRVLGGLEVAAFAAESRGEPLVVLTHSMGGQIVYDLVTHFLPRLPEHRALRIDYWAAAASQVGFFEELGLFLESRPDRGQGPAALTPLPSREFLGGWWNVWDHADLLSFRAAGIFEGVDDSPFFAAGSLTTDHNKYLSAPEFYRQFADRLHASLGRHEGRTT